MNNIDQIKSSLDFVGWTLLFLGWVLYWLKNLDNERRKDTRSFWSAPVKQFLLDNVIEIPISAIACLVIAILSNDIPADIIDLHGRISILLAGYSSSSILNSLLSYCKPAVKPQEGS
jgi:hypothetical protein